MFMTWCQCPNRFKLQFVDNVAEEAEVVATGQEEGMGALALGRLFHELAFKLFDYVDVNHMKTLQPEQIEGYLISRLPANIPDETRLALMNLCQIEANRWNAMEDKTYWFPVFREKEFRNEEKRTEGALDRVDRLDKNAYVLVEYKTGKFDQWRLTSVRRELAFYKEMTEDLILPPDGYFSHYAAFYVSQNILVFERFKPQTITAFQKKYVEFKQFLKDMRTAKKENKPFEAHKNIGMLCNWCPVSTTCLKNEMVV